MASAMGKQGQAAMTRVAVNSAVLNVTSVPIDNIKLWMDNPRKNDAAVPRLAKLLEEHGQRSPLVVWRKNMTIYKGNTTWKAAKSLGWDKINVVLTDFPSEAAATAYGISDNKASEWSDWDDDILSQLMRADESLNKNTTGFSDKELAALRLSAGLPDKLDAATLIGDSATMGKYLVIQFENKDDIDRFREWMEMGKQERTILFPDMIAKMGVEW